MEALLRADRFFGVSLLLLQVTEASFLAAFILAGGVATTFELFTYEWLNNPVRVKAAQEAQRLAGVASAAASNARASALGVRSARTDEPDGMGLCIAGGHAHVKKEAAALDISADEYVEAQRRAGIAASNARASALGVRSSRMDEPDGLGLCLAGGHEQVKKEAAALDISAEDYVEAQRSNRNFFNAAASSARASALGVRSARELSQMAAVEAAALANRGRRNPNIGTSRHESALQLGNEVGSAVMGKEVWEEYIKTSSSKMPKHEKPFPCGITHQSSQSRSAGDRDGWIFLHAKKIVGMETISRWSMTDWITYRLPDGSEEKESFRTAISQAYHRNWERYSRMERLNKRDKDAGKLLVRR